MGITKQELRAALSRRAALALQSTPPTDRPISLAEVPAARDPERITRDDRGLGIVKK
jgi:hypothetical protein